MINRKNVPIMNRIDYSPTERFVINHLYFERQLPAIILLSINNLYAVRSILSFPRGEGGRGQHLR